MKEQVKVCIYLELPYDSIKCLKLVAVLVRIVVLKYRQFLASFSLSFSLFLFLPAVLVPAQKTSITSGAIRTSVPIDFRLELH